VTLTWLGPASGPAPINGYVITAYDADQPVGTVSSTATVRTKAFTGLTNGKSYRFTVAGKNAYGVGQKSALSAPLVAGLPTAPSGVSAVTGNGRATVRWTAAVGNGSIIVSYTVTPYIGTHAQTPRVFNSTATSQVITGLENGRQYTFRVAGSNVHGTGPRSGASRVIRIGVPGAPGGVSAAAAIRAAKVQWTAPSGNGAAITGYVITPYIGSHPQTARTYNSAATTEWVRGLQSGRLYTFRVAAVNARGTGAKSAESNHIRVK
jgi:hypothetical protein